MPLRHWLLSIMILSSTACTTYQSSNQAEQATGFRSSEGGRYFESSYDDKNRAPASLTPPLAFGDDRKMDPAYVQEQADYHFALGESLSYQGKNQNAIEEFKLVLAYDKNSSLIFRRLAAEYLKLGLVTEALEYAEQSVKIDPKDKDSKLLLGSLFYALKLYPKAILQYEDVLKLDPDNTEAPLYIGATYAEEKMYDKAVKYFESLAKNDEFTTPHLAYYYIGKVRVEQEDKKFLKAAESAFKKALEIKPDHAETVLALGALYNKLGQKEKTLSLYKTYQKDFGPSFKIAEVLSQTYMEEEKFEEALEQLEVLEKNSDDPLNAKVKIALIFIEKKKFTAAVEKLHEIIKLVPDSDKIRFYLAAVYEEMNSKPEAVEHFLKIQPDSQYYPDSVLHATYLLKTLQQTDKAIKVVTDGIKNNDQIPQFYALYASLLDEKNDHKTAVKMLTAASEKFPDNVQIKFYLGTVFDKLGDKEKVVTNMKQVIEMDPNHSQGLNYLAFTYAEMNSHLDEAEKLARRAFELDPKDGYVLDTLGWVLFKKGLYKDSLKTLEAAFQLTPQESIIAEHLGDVYMKNQLVEKAKEMYEKAVTFETDSTKIKLIKEKLTSLDKQQYINGGMPTRIPASTGP